MEKFVTLSGVAAPLPRANVDTDAIIRIERLTGTRRDEMGAHAFEMLRGQKDFPFDRPEFEGAPMLIAGANFGCGSSREGAVWALQGMGLRCVIAESFGDIFYNNCFQNGLLPVALPADAIKRLIEQTAGGNARVTVDLQRRMVVAPRGEEIPFAIDAMRREALLDGLDDIGLTLKHSAAIAEYQARDRAARPWIWQPGA
jgi:3-isopropylmalate/(R)-2-methylmalate dehydratase small subunit